MRKSRVRGGSGVWPCVRIGLVGARPASADADKEHKLLMAEIRMLQEEQQQLRAVLARPRRHAQGAEHAARRRRRQARRRRSPIRSSIVDGVAETTRILREKADETNVRLSSMTQELQSLRQTVSSMPPAPSAPAAPIAEPQRPIPAPPTPGARRLPAPTHSAAEHLTDADVGSRLRRSTPAGQFDLAVEGFQSYIRTFPTSPQADDAQLYIGYSLYSAGKYQRGGRRRCRR